MLALKIYGIVNEFNTKVIVLAILSHMTNILKLLLISLIVCTDYYSIYKCLVK